MRQFEIENYNDCEVIACCVDLGQCADYDRLKEKALKTGAKKAIVVDAKEEFITDYTILYTTHRELERLCLDRKTTAFKETVAAKLAELIYGGEWFTPLREALSLFVDKTQETVSGVVKLKLYKGNVKPAGCVSPFWLVKKGVTFRDAHEIAGKLVLYAIKKKIRLEELTIEELKKASTFFDETYYEAISIEKCVDARDLPGGPGVGAMAEAIRNAEMFIDSL